MHDARSLEDARRAIWPTMQDSEIDPFQTRLSEVLTIGDFHFVGVAQRFTQSMENTGRYLNQSMKQGKFYLVEMIRYRSPAGPDTQTISAYGGQMIARPEGPKTDPAARTTRPGSWTPSAMPSTAEHPDLRACAGLNIPVVEEFNRRGRPVGPSHRVTYREFEGPTESSLPVRQVIAFSPRKNGEIFDVTANRPGRSKASPSTNSTISQ
ncbi:hypothetical protein ACQPYH_29515 [Kribbella sp. CA-245084]|uniref:hypothetical protein n=1 Tax=Kribbella sp. CA-245084 TaxID=3239940 RepID=UPI003D9384D6